MSVTRDTLSVPSGFSPSLRGVWVETDFAQPPLKYIYTSRKPVRCTGKLLKIKSKLIFIPFTSF